MTQHTPNSDAWTVNTLREYMLAIIEANDRKYSEKFLASDTAVSAAAATQLTAMQTALVAQKLAVDTAQIAAALANDKSEKATDKRFDAVNEFRAVLTAQQATFITRNEMELFITSVTDKIDHNTNNITEMNRMVAQFTGQKSGVKESWVYVLGGVSILTLIASIILHFLPT